MSQLDRHHSQPALSYSGVPTPTAFETLKQRLQMLEVENRRLMNNQGQLVADTNKRVEVSASLHASRFRVFQNQSLDDLSLWKNY